VEIVSDHLPRPSKVAGPSGPTLNALAAQPKPGASEPQVAGPRAELAQN
jgi:hypothetical protein